MRRREFLALAAAQFQPAMAQRRPPNIIWIMADDLGYADLGCYGQKYIQTPNIDSLARDGMRFTDAYAGCTVCAPSRSVLMTGLHGGHTPVRTNEGSNALLATDYTVAQMLKAGGYATGGFGKWGLGDEDTSGNPIKQGFDEFFGYLNQWHAHYYYPQFLFENEKRYALPGNMGGKRGQYAPDVIADRLLDFIQRNARNPFFCYVPAVSPHMELNMDNTVPADSMAEYETLPEGIPPVRRTYAAMISRLDRDVGRVLRLIKKLAIEENTLVFFCSDNGVANQMVADGFFHGEGPFRAGKGSMYEGGLRTPMLARWPKKIRAGHTSNLPWYFADVMATFAELSGGRLPAQTDGISIVPELLGKSGQRQHEFMYWELAKYNPRFSTFGSEVPAQALRMDKWKAVRPEASAPLELYDLSTDLAETRNVADENPAVLGKIRGYMKTARTEPRRQLTRAAAGPY